jgi:hypothetical protein
MKRQYEETRTYDIFGPVKITYEFAGDMNDGDFTVFKRDYLCKAEKKDFKLRDYPKKFRAQVDETIKGLK